MLALPAMEVVIALRESITLGREESLTAAEGLLRSEAPRCHRDELGGDAKMKRGKPHKRETQIW